MADDAPRLITRRRSLMLLGSGAGGLFIVGCGSSGGTTLAASANANDYVANAAKTCKPIANAGVDIWHCNAAGLYSDKSDQGTNGQTWLRGVQFTDKHGLATFQTIYAGHYQGRTTHIHIKVHTGATDSKGKLTGGHVAHTGNLFPTEAVSNAVYELSPYKADTAAIVPQARDMVYSGQHGSTARMKVTKAGNRLTKGLVGRITVAVDPTATPALVGIHG